ncbi:UDP-N-acetylglucosamine diphosphorylase 2 [Selaginella moellendorffii]|uniref:UDP-N-acetylglucosamine diphosphorylase 2 n=1 Tax=Selaginella moellendorffii TaxID=88036 RepID=UPI000D1C49DC|nr:UDP-N-acetylglucosamine diphosphorylase 2 [Selaginella moellendorffii]|eukprot:XP_024532253.1 UDP-N-acetylglucosamine diphosphorylase 2 [Selaginella moellendorffii]
MGEALLDAGGESMLPPQAFLERLKDFGQEHTLGRWKELNEVERDELICELEAVDLPRVSRIARKTLQRGDSLRNPVPLAEASVSCIEERTAQERERWWGLGLKAISEGKLAVLLLSGGQGTRLGSNDPKGCINIGLPSGKSLFQLQAERILRIQKLASNRAGSGRLVMIPWYIMTSPFTDTATRQFFEAKKYFGLEAQQVIFFQQGTLPCVTKEGKIIMESACKISRAPDGNGGVYAALKSSGHLEDMAKRGIHYVDCFSVDNALVRVADPLFLGYCIDRNVSCAAKAVKKLYPQERVGVFVRRAKNGPVAVLEYSELDPALASSVNQETGRLNFKWSNICMQMYSLEFLAAVTDELEQDSIYHVAEKTIPSADGPVQGIKLEQYIFDAFPYAPSVAIFEVVREEEFAPVKNVSGVDSPESARLLLLRLHMRWVVAAGGFILHSVPLHLTGVEVSPLISYAGENLEEICHGRSFHVPCEIR